MKIFISQPMKGKTDREIWDEREKIITECKEKNGEVEIIDSFFEANPAEGVNSGLWYLGKSIEALATASGAYFADGWDKYRGCKIEHECAVQYGIEIIKD